MIPSSPLRRAIVVSVALHAVAAIIAGWLVVPAKDAGSAVVDIEIAPPVPLPEALPPEVARPTPREPDRAAPDDPTEAEPASTAPGQPGEAAIDAGVDARPDAALDAPRDARPDAAIDAAPDAAPDAVIDAGIDAGDLDATSDAVIVAGAELDADRADAGVEAIAVGDAAEVVAHAGDAAIDDATQVASAGSNAGAPGKTPDGVTAASSLTAGSNAAGSNAVAASSAGSNAGAAAGSGSGAGSAIDTAALAAALAATMPGPPGTAAEPAVDGAPTTAGTAANLLSYFPDGHIVTALIRFDRLRGTEWAAQTELLLRPMPDYQLLFGARDAGILDKIETLVISTPRPRDAAATTLVARTQLPRGALRDALAAGAPVTWSVARGGLVGRRTGKRFPSDQRVFLSPFQGWFLLAQPGDLGDLLTPARGKLDTAVASGALPPWLAGIRAIESESGETRGPALVVTVAPGGARYDLPGFGIGIGVRSIPTPDRASLAAELVPQGWLVRGNLRFASDADAAEFVASVQRVQQRFAGPALQAIVGKRLARVIAALAFARNGPRVSYATSVSIADARAILAAVGKQIEQYFRRPP